MLWVAFSEKCAFDIHWLDITLKPLTVEVNSNDHLMTIKEKLGTGTHVDITWHAPPTQTPLQTKYSALMAPALPDGNGCSTMPPASHIGKTVMEWPEVHDKELKVSSWTPNSQIPIRLIKSDPCSPNCRPDWALTHQVIDIGPLGSSCGFWYKGIVEDLLSSVGCQVGPPWTMLDLLRDILSMLHCFKSWAIW